MTCPLTHVANDMIGILDTDLQLPLHTGPVAASHSSALSLSAFRSERHALTPANQHLGFAAEHFNKKCLKSELSHECTPKRMQTQMGQALKN